MPPSLMRFGQYAGASRFDEASDHDGGRNSSPGRIFHSSRGHIFSSHEVIEDLSSSYPRALSPSKIALPPETEMELESLMETEVAELRGFSDKALWIQQKIDFLRTLPDIDCFGDLIPTFSDPSTSKLQLHSLPTRKELDEMFAEQDRIEEEADRFDAGDLVRLRKMAKAASKKSLSRADTDLLAITLSTLYLLDTLLNLLRARGETLDLLSLRLEFDELRFQVGREVLSWETDVREFVEEKARWGLDQYRSAFERGGSATSTGDEPMSDGKRVASRSQRYLLIQILDLDCQSLQNRISAFSSGPLVSTGRLLDKMIDVASSIKSKKRRITSSISSFNLASLAEAEEEGEDEKGGAVPEWFLDEMDQIEERCGALRSQHGFAASVAEQWKHIDNVYHSVQKLSSETDSVVSLLAQATLNHSSISTSAQLSDRITQISRQLNLLPNPLSRSSQSFPRPNHPFFPDQHQINVELANLLGQEFEQTTSVLDKAIRQAEIYTKAAERVDRLDQLHASMVGDSRAVQAAMQQLKEGVSDHGLPGSPIDLSSSTCLLPDAHSLFLAQVPLHADTISSAQIRSPALLRQCATLLLMLRSANMDPNYKAAVEKARDELQMAVDGAVQLRDQVLEIVSTLVICREVQMETVVVAAEGVALKEAVLSELERARWSEDPQQQGADETTDILLRNRLTALDASLKSTASKLSPLLIAWLSDQSPAILSHLQTHLTTLHRRSSSLRDLLHLLHLVRSQTEALRSVQDESLPLREQIRVHLDNVRTQLQRVITAGNTNAPSSSDLDLDQLASNISAFTSSLHSRIPFVNSPNHAAALQSDRPLLAITSRNVLLTPPGSPTYTSLASLDIPSSPVSSMLDLSSLDACVRSAANQIATSLTGAMEELRAASHLIPIAKNVKDLEKSLKVAEDGLAEAKELVLVSLPNQLAQIVESPSPIPFDVDFESKRLSILRAFLSTASSTLQPQLEPTRSSVSSLERQSKPLSAQPHLIQEHLQILPLLPRLQKFLSASEELEFQADSVRKRIDETVQDQCNRIAEEARRVVQEAERESSRLLERERLEEADLAQKVEREKVEVERLRLEEIERTEEARKEGERLEAVRLAAVAREVEEREEQQRKQEEDLRLDLEAQRRRKEDEQRSIRSATVVGKIGSTHSSSPHATPPMSEAPLPSLAHYATVAIDVFGPISPVKSTSSRHSLSPSPRPSPQSDPIPLRAPSPQAKSSESFLDVLLRLQQQLDSLDLDSSSTSVSRLDHASDILSSVQAETALLAPASDIYDTESLLHLHHTLSTLSFRLSKDRMILDFDASVSACDAALSKLLDEIDAFPCSSRPSTPLSSSLRRQSSSRSDEKLAVSSREEGIRRTLDAASMAHQSVLSLSQDLPSSPHVSSEASRVTAAFMEMKEMVEDLLNPSLDLQRRVAASSASASSVRSSSAYGGDEGLPDDDFPSELLDRSLSSLSRSSRLSRSSSSTSFSMPSKNTLRRSTSSISKLPRQTDDPRTLSSVRSRSSLSNDKDVPIPRRSTSSLSQQPRRSTSSLMTTSTRPASSAGIALSDREPLRSQVPLTKSSSTFGLATAARAMRSSLGSLPQSYSSSSLASSLSRLPQLTTRRGRISGSSSSFSLSASTSSLVSPQNTFSPPSSRIPTSSIPSSQHTPSKLPSRSRLPSSFGMDPSAPRSTSGSSSTRGETTTNPLLHSMSSTASSRSRSSMPLARPRTSSTISDSSSSTHLSLRTILSPVPSPARSSPSRIPTIVSSPQQRSRSSLSQQAPTSTRLSAADRFSSTPSRRRSSSVRNLADLADSEATPTGKPTSGSIPKRKQYIAKEGDKLDKAVGKIVNSFSVEIAITPVVSGPSSESGKYWIGQPPKLCFCRILRSKTVMVRVGGGWVELSKFLRDHFGINIPAPSSTGVSVSSPTASITYRSPYAGGIAPSSPWIRNEAGEAHSVSSSTSSRMLWSPPKTSTTARNSTYLLSTPSRSHSTRLSTLSPPDRHNDLSPSDLLFYPTSPSSLRRGERDNSPAADGSGTPHQTPTFSYRTRRLSALPPLGENAIGEGVEGGSPVAVEIMRKADEGASPSYGMIGLGIGSPLGTRGDGDGRRVSGNLSGIPWR